MNMYRLLVSCPDRPGIIASVSRYLDESGAKAESELLELIGATAHDVTEELDAGSIIEQAVSRASHRDDVEALKRVGAGIERDVVARAVKWHCEDRVVCHGNSTVVF